MQVRFGNLPMSQLKLGTNLKTNDWAGNERHVQYLTTVQGRMLEGYEGRRIGNGYEGLLTPEEGAPTSLLLLEKTPPFAHSPILHRVDINPRASELPDFALDRQA